MCLFYHFAGDFPNRPIEPHELVQSKEDFRNFYDMSPDFCGLYWKRHLFGWNGGGNDEVWSQQSSCNFGPHPLCCWIWCWAYALGAYVRNSSNWPKSSLHRHSCCLCILQF